jgi:hypothetical protein
MASVESAVAQELERRAMKIIGAGAGDDIDDGSGGSAYTAE